MRIGVIAASLSRDTPADTGYVITALLTEVCRLHPEHTFVFFLDKISPLQAEWPQNVTPVIVPVKGTTAWHRYWWREWQLPRAVKAQRPALQLLLGMDGNLPLRSKLPAHLFINDMSFLHSVAGIPARRQQSLKKNTVRYIQQAKKVLVLSHTLQQEVLQYAPDAASRVQLLAPGLDESYRPLQWEEREEVKQEFAGGVEYFIVPGSLHPRNNILPLLKAFSALKRRLHSNMKLVLAGAATAAGAELAVSFSTYRFRKDVVWLQDTDQQTLARLIGGAYALIYTARFEGLAMPVYAAMKCQVPVIALEGAAAREAGGEAVLYADPESLEDLADKMCRLYKDEELRSRLLQKIDAGKLPGSWDAAADLLIS